MASFTDKAPTFNPYVQQQPIEAMVQVGTFKQQQYDQNLQSIQTSMNKVAGLNIARDVDKQYLKSKMSEVTSKLQTFAAGDFSSANLTRSMTGMIAEVGGDEIVQNAVLSTQNYQNQLRKIQASEKDGTLTPDNLYNFQKQASPWLNGTTPGEAFNGQYTEHFDVLKYVREVFDDIKPDEYTYDEVFKLGADGNPLTDKNGVPILSEHMTRLEKAGRFPEKVQQTINQIFSEPRVNKQLGITGEYNYKDYGDSTLMAMRDARREVEMERYAGMIDQLTTQKAFASEAEKANLDIQIDAIKDASAQTYDAYSKVSDPDAIRAMIYTDNVRNNYTKMFSNVTTKTQVMNNPAWQAKFDMQKEANAQSRWAQQFQYTKERDFVKDNQWAADHSVKVAKQLAEEEKNNASNFITGPEQSVESNTYSALAAHNIQLDNAKFNYKKASDDLVYKTVLSDQSSTINNLIASGVSREDAISQVIENIAASRGKSKEEYVTAILKDLDGEANDKSKGQKERSAVVNDLYKNYKKAEEELKLQTQISKTADNILFNALPNRELNTVQPTESITILGEDGSSYTLSPGEQYDLALYLKSQNINSIVPKEEDKTLLIEGEEAKNRLLKKGKGVAVSTAINEIGGGKPKYNPYAPYNPNTVNVNNWSSVTNAYQGFNDNYKDALEKKATYLRKVGFKNPNTVRGITTGKTEVDKLTLATLKRIAGEEKSNQTNVSPTADDFFTLINGASSLTDLSIGQKQIVDERGNIIASIVINTEAGPKELVITRDQARSLKIDLDIYASPEATMVDTKIGLNTGTMATTEKDIGNINTYVGKEADYTFDTDFFPQLNQSKEYDARMNIEKNINGYYPYIFIRKIDSAGNVYQDVLSLSPLPTAQDAINAAKTFVKPSNIENILRNNTGK